MPDPKNIEREIEQARESLAATVDQLAYRAHPKTIASREAEAMKARFVDVETGKPRTDTIAKVVGGVAAAVVLFVVVRKLAR